MSFQSPLERAEQMQAWLQSARDGSSASLGKLLDTCRNYLLLIANQTLDAGLRAKLGPSDLVQETFLRAQKHLTDFQGGSEEEFLAWLRQILLNQVSDARRDLDPHKRDIDREAVESQSQLPDQGESPEANTLLLGAGFDFRRSADVAYAEIGRFRIVRELGRGGCGVVFLAHDPLLSRDVALKVPLPEILATPEWRRRFLREAQAAAQLDHPNVVRVHESGEVGPIAYIAYAYCSGPTLSRWLKEEKASVLPGAAAALILVLAHALDHCHGRGVLHRDLKPSNVLLASGGVRAEGLNSAARPSPLSALQPMITDFGLARLEVPSVDKTRTGTVMGTAAYMAPEQAQGDLQAIGPHTDVHALGAILYELLAGRPAFRGTSEVDTMRAVLQDDPPALASLGRKVHRDLETICRKCLEKSPRRRYAGADELAGDLERFLNGEPILARPIGPLERASRWARRHRAAAVLLASSLFVLLTVLPGWIWYDKSLRDSEHRHQQAELSAAQERKARKAAEENANTQRYFSIFHRLRQRSSQKPLGWTWAGLTDVAELARIDTDARNPVDLRSEAATLLSGVDVREKSTLADKFSAYCLAFSPDGRLLAAGQDLATAFLWAPIRIYDSATGQLRFELSYPTRLAQLPTGPAPDGAICLAFAADGKRLAVGTRSGQIHCWDFTATPPRRVSWQASTRRVNEIHFHPHKAVLYSVSHGDNAFKSWDAAAGKELARHDAGKAVVHGIALRKDAKVLAAIVDNKIAYFDADSLRDLGQTRANDDHLDLFTLRYSPDGRFLAVQGAGGTLMLIDPDGMEVRRFSADGAESAHRGEINRLEFSPGGSLLFSASESEKDRTLKIWEVASGRLLAGMGLGETGPLAFAVDPGGKALASAANKRIVLHELAGGDVETFQAQHPHRPRTVVFSAAGGWMACGGEYRHSRVPLHFLSVWQTSPEKMTALHHLSNDAEKLTWSPIALAFHPKEPILAASGWSNNVWLFDSAKRISPIACKEPGPLAFDRDGKKLWAILDERTVQSWHWPSGETASTWRHQPLTMNGRDQLYCLAPAGRWLLVGGRDGQTHLLRSDTGKPESAWPGNDAPIRAIAVPASADWAAVGSQDGLVRIISVPDGKVLASCRDHLAGIEAIAVSPADAFLAASSTDNRVHLYAMQNRQPILYATLSFPAGPVRSLCFHPGANQLALIAGPETAVRVWNLDKFQNRLADLGIR